MGTRFNDADDPTAYERLLFDVLRGDRSHFVRSDELEAAWKIFDDVPHQLDNGELDPIPYVYGSRGPPAADDFVADRGYIHSAGYSWSASVPDILALRQSHASARSSVVDTAIRNAVVPLVSQVVVK